MAVGCRTINPRCLKAPIDVLVKRARPLFRNRRVRLSEETLDSGHAISLSLRTMTEGKVLAYSEINEAIVFSAVPALLRRRPIAAAFQFVEVVGVKRTESLLSARITRSP